MKEMGPLISIAEFKRRAKKGIRLQNVIDEQLRIFAPGGGRVKDTSASPDERMATFILSNSHRDRENDSIDVHGWNLDSYRANPVVLFAHMHDSLPIGRSKNVYV